MKSSMCIYKGDEFTASILSLEPIRSSMVYPLGRCGLPQLFTTQNEMAENKKAGHATTALLQ